MKIASFYPFKFSSVSDSFCVEGIGGEEYTNEEMEGISIQRDIIGEDTVLKQSANFSIDFCLFDNNQITIESHDLVSTEKCQKCCRRSTVWYPLEYKVLKSQSIMKRKFGLKVVGNARLCQECFQYVSVCGDIWKNAWPSVLFDLVFVKANHKMVELFFKLPRQIQFSWLFDRLKYKGRKIEQPLFLDITRDIFEFNRLIGSYLIKDYREALTRYPFPSVRCICGASEFIERAGDIELKHLLNYIESGFSDFHANWKNNLRCIRSDFLELCDNQLVFQLRPTVKVTSDGLVLCLCSYHSKGSSRAMIHVPRHPVVGNIMHESADRFSPLVCSLRNATPAKVGEFSNTFTMSQSVGGSNGVGSLTLHSFRNLNIRSDFLLHALESTFLNNRIDMRGFFEELADENKFTEEDTKGFIGKPFYHKRDFEKCVGSATYVPMTHMTNLKEDERSHILTNRKNYVIVENNCSNSGSKAVFPTKTCFNLNYNISLFLTILFCLPRFSEFFTVLDNTFWDPVSKIRRKIHLRKAGFKELYEKIHSFLGTNENDTFIEFWQKLSLKMGSISILKENLGPHSGLNKIKQPIILKLFKRGIKKNIEDVIFSGQYQIVARECSPLRNKYNLSLHRYIPRNSTIQIKTKDGTCKAFPGIVSESCNYRLLVYVLKPFISWDPMNIVSGQSKVSCVFHKQLLCCDQPKSNFICSENTCKLVSRWRCPKTSCAFCLCSKHFALVSHGNQLVLKKDVDKFVIAPFENEEETTSECPIQDDFLFHGLDEAVDVHNLLCNANTSEELFCGPSSSTNQLSESFDTDAGADFFPVVKQEKEGEDCKFLPIQVLFNVVNSVLVRPCTPINASLRFKRFLQCFVSRSPSSALSLIQLEALLFPSIFYYQTSDGSCPGAMPFFIYNCQKNADKMGFAGLIEHFRTRIADVSLLTSSSHRYIQFAVDCLINLQLNRKHSQTFFQRGMQSLNLYGEETKVFQKDITFISNDTEKCVRQLSAAIASSTVNFFLTLTCNQKMHPGVAPITEAIEKSFLQKNDETKKAAISSYMSTLVRCWSRSVQLLVNLLTHSAENILGKIEKIWGRAEFQCTVGNLPHYHILLWIKPGTFDTEDLIKCSSKNILSSIRDIAQSSLGLVENTEKDIQSLYNLCLDIHTHCCARGSYRCHKRVDLDGNKICRTPPYPQSHHHWVMEIDQQYPVETLKYLEKLGFAKFNDGNNSKVFGKLKCEKYMYAAERGEHILPVSVPLFALTKSSVNLLRVLFRFSCSYLTSYAGKSEEHADGRITTASGGKAFRLRTEGIQNKSLASVKFTLDVERKNNRNVKNIRCQFLAITESVFWLFGEPYVFHNMNFIHIQNVPIEKRFVVQKKSPINKRTTVNSQNFRDFVEGLPNFRKLTYHQKVLLEDSNNSLEVLDKMSAFNLRPPELLCVANVKQYYCFFEVKRLTMSIDELLYNFRNETPMPWIDCLGNEVKLRASAFTYFEAELMQSCFDLDGMDNERREYLLHLLRENTDQIWLADSFDNSLLPEIVFRSVRPSDELNFLVSFLLRFGYFHTELDLMRNEQLVTSYQLARIIDVRDSYDSTHVDYLVKKYLEEELIYLPGGVLTFSAKLMSARVAFSRLLSVQSDIVLNNPTVLIEDIHSNTMQAVEEFVRTTQEAMVSRIRQLGISNLPLDPLNNLLFWEPILFRVENQESSSFIEQQSVLNKIRTAFVHKFSNDQPVRHQVILGNPGTGKTYLSGVVLGLSICNGMLSFVTSLASRRAEQLSGEHIHRFFKISTKKLDSQSLANEALIKLSFDHKRRFILSSIKVLIVEEISLINAELWCAMDLILRQLRDNDQSFGGVFVVANGDCCQLPNITGYNIFDSYSFLFTFDFHFLENFVRMADPIGQELLRQLEKRPIEESTIENIVETISSRCNFVPTWSQLNDSMIMKVFGKKIAESEALDAYFEEIRNAGIAYKINEARDEICNEGCKDIWRVSDSRNVSIFLNKSVSETEKVIFHQSCVLRATQNINGIQQGQVCVVDYDSLSDSEVFVFVAPCLEDITWEALQSEQFKTWRRISVKKQAGFIQSYFRHSVRRVQFPLANYVALTVHKLMGDTFVRLATALSSVERKFSLWLISQCNS